MKLRAAFGCGFNRSMQHPPKTAAESCLVFAATDDQPKLFAYALGNGRLLWEKNLPAPSQATPMTYSSNGHQFVVVTAGGEDSDSRKPGDYIIAFSVA